MIVTYENTKKNLVKKMLLKVTLELKFAVVFQIKIQLFLKKKATKQGVCIYNNVRTHFSLDLRKPVKCI
jgi:hypothetical protein